MYNNIVMVTKNKNEKNINFLVALVFQNLCG